MTALNDYFANTVWREGDPPLVGDNPPVVPRPQNTTPRKPISRAWRVMLTAAAFAVVAAALWWLYVGPIPSPLTPQEIVLGAALALLYWSVALAIAIG